MSKKTKAECTMDPESVPAKITLDADSIHAIALGVKDMIFEELQSSMVTMVHSVVSGVMNDLTTRIDTLDIRVD